MAPYDWNKNGRNDSFDRYMDYQASHSTSNSNQQSSGSSSYQYSNSSNINQDGGMFPSQHTDEEKKPPYLLASIIGFLGGMIFFILMLMANR